MLSNNRTLLTNKDETQGGKRTALSTISVNVTNSKTRVQPSRAAKQVQTWAKSTSSSLLSTSSSLSISDPPSLKSSSQGFTIFEDVPSAKAASVLQSDKVKPALLSDEDKENRENVTARKIPRKTPPGCLQSPEDMDVSISENFLMAVDSQSTPGEEILQSRDDDIFDIPEYAADIYKYLRSAELCHKPRVNYMAKQNDITASMRWILIDWLVEVAEEYELHSETLSLAVSYVDRFLSQMSVKRDKLQLVGTTAMFIAAKYEEIYPPQVEQFAYITDNTYKKSQILRMEHLILKVLSFDMAVPTALLFVNRFSKLCNCSKETTHLAYFLSELSMLDCDPFLRYLPSMIAASAVALANYTQGKPIWPEDVVSQTQYRLSDLKECYINLNTAFCRIHEAPQHSIRDKYKAAKWNSVSLLSPREGFPWSS